MLPLRYRFWLPRQKSPPPGPPSDLFWTAVDYIVVLLAWLIKPARNPLAPYMFIRSIYRVKRLIHAFRTGNYGRFIHLLGQRIDDLRRSTEQ